MKKISSVLLVLALLLLAVPTALAAGNAGWNGPAVVRAGDTITLTFYAGGGIYGGSGTVSYDPNVLTLQGYSQSIGGSWALEWGGNNFIFYDNSMASPITDSSAIFRATFTVNASAPVGSQVTVSATGVTLSDGEQDTGIGTVSYSTTIAEPLSGNCNLAELTVNGAQITPAFSPDVTYYTASVPFEVSSVGLHAVAEDDGATLSFYNPQLTPGETTVLQVTVTAENGTQKAYTIAVFRAQDPNYVPSSNADLQSLSVEGYPLSPAFLPEVTQYYIWLPYEVDNVIITASPADAKATCTVGDGANLPAGERADIPVTVTAEDGSQKVYTVTVVRAPAHDRVEDYLSGRLNQPEPEPTEPETQPATEPETQPETTVPATTDPAPAIQEQPQEASFRDFILPCGLSVLVGAGLMGLITLLLKKKK